MRSGPVQDGQPGAPRAPRAEPAARPDGGQLRIRVRYGYYTTPWFDYLLESPKELAELAEGTDWELTRVIGEGGSSYVGVLERHV